MASNSSIEWTESTWNPVTGCTKISPGCQHCYAERMAHRLRAMGQPNYVNGFTLTTHEHAVETPLTWKSPQMIFVNSMSDLFHEDIPEDLQDRLHRVLADKTKLGSKPRQEPAPPFFESGTNMEEEERI